MPIIVVRYAAMRDVMPKDVAGAASVACTGFLRKKADLTAIIAEPVDRAPGFIAGQDIAGRALASFWLDIRVVEGTNTKEECEHFIAAIFESMGQLLGPIHQESYVHIHEVRAEAYDHMAQEVARRTTALLKTAQFQQLLKESKGHVSLVSNRRKSRQSSW